jgi:hypothetical protein
LRNCMKLFLYSIITANFEYLIFISI